MANYKETKAYQEWLQLVDQIKLATPVDQQEDEKGKEARIERLQKDPVKFCKYYFPHYIKSPFGWFHKKAFKETYKNNSFTILEWPREHAKSVLAQVFIPMFQLANKELTGMITISNNEKKAIKLLGDLKAELGSNQRWINDYGELARRGDWTDGQFSLTSGQGFWAYGRGQTPRGARNAAMRPNLCVIDDIDDKVICRNQERVGDVVQWVMEDVYGCLPIKGSKVIVAGNRIHKHSILAHLVGDLEHGDPKRDGITHIKVFALEKAGASHQAGDEVPAWKENYTRDQLKTKFRVMGYIAVRREYFHEHHESGKIFMREHIQWRKLLPLKKYKHIVTYCDPSWKETKKADTKAIITAGIRDDGTIDILDIWVRNASTSAMIGVFYDRFEKYESFSTYWMEANFMQDIILDDFEAEGNKRGEHIPIRGDKRKKPDKVSRIENLQPLFERGLIYFNEAIRKDIDTQTFLDQLFGFPTVKDDGPDALEGGIYKLMKRVRSSRHEVRSGKYNKGSNKYAIGASRQERIDNHKRVY